MRSDFLPSLTLRGALSAVVALVLLNALSACTPPAAPGPECNGPPGNEIVAENCHQGAIREVWDTLGQGDPGIQGFATQISVDQGERIDFKIKTDFTGYNIDIYRLGYYSGNGARRYAGIQPSAALPQHQPDCDTQPSTGLVDCGNWSVSASWNVPADAVSGIYVARIQRKNPRKNNLPSHIPFIVRDDDGASDVLVQVDDTTWQAYNRYGGNSLYTGGPGTNPGRAFKVSYNRPFTTRDYAPEDWIFNSTFPMVRWLERNGYDVSYSSGLDSARHGAEIQEHKTFMSLGHDEYWSGHQRDNVRAARDAGTNLAFFSGNESFWKTRWEPSIDGSATADRTLVSYKETHANAKIDPQANVWTGSWRDGRPFNPEGANPENALSGTIFMVNDGTSAIKVPADDGRMRLWRNTSVANQAAGSTATLASGTLGYEWDEDLDNGVRPAGLIHQSTTTVDGVQRLQDNGSNYADGTATHHLTLYRDTNGAGPDSLVFAAGTIQWPWGLDGVHDRGASTPDQRMQQATVNLLADLGAQPTNLQGDLTPATASGDTTAPASTITSPAAGAAVEKDTPVTIRGTAADGEGTGVVGGVEVSTDDGQTWHPAAGREDWRYTWTPTQQGQATIRTRAADDSGNLEGPSAGVTVTVGTGAPRTCPCSIFEPTDDPASPTANNDGQPIEVGVKFRPDKDGFVTGLRFWKAENNSGTHTGHLWSAGGQQLAAATFTGESGSGWQEVQLDQPVAVDANTTYVASYQSSSGYYSSDVGYFATALDNPPLHALANGLDGPNGVYEYGASAFPDQTFQSSNYWVDVVFERTAGPDLRAPKVASTSPGDGAPDVDPDTTVRAVFDEAMDPATVSGTTFRLRNAAGSLVPADVAYSAATRTATLTPRSRLAFSTDYTATVAAGVTDASGNHLAQDRTWSFTTAAAPQPPPEQGPGGPILVVSATGNPFGRYYAEILRAEGLNAFAVRDIADVSASVLGGYDIVVLAETSLSDTQTGMLSDWVQGGGNLIAMRPDARLGGLLGLTGAGGSPLSNAYLKVDTSSPPGAGITGQTIQFHGPADRYTLSGATEVARLYSGANSATPNPAVTLRSVGGAGGQAAAFTYDLARSIVYTRQGNPDWAGDERDGQDGPIRPDDLFYGAKAGDVQPDWVDLGKVAIPQADEQQRLLANLIIHMSRDRKPMPRFWYLPRGDKAAVVLTGDDHGSGGTVSHFERFKADSPAGCSVANWECIRSTSYVYPNVPISNAQATGYQADGFELALHVNTGCSNFTAASLAADFSSQLATFASNWPSLSRPVTDRTHCIPWSDWASHPKVEHQNGIRFDTNYYYWPAEWVQDRPGMFTGSGMPMRFADLDGSMIDVYQAATQITDESGQDVPNNIAALLDKAQGPEGYYGAFTANIHTDNDVAPAEAIVAAAKARGVPVVSARQMLTWIDARNASTFENLSFAGGHLHFSIRPGAGARGLQAMVPTDSATGSLTGLTRDGTAVSTTNRTIKGIEYAFFTATAGDYVATYRADTAPPDITGVAATARENGTATVTWDTDEPSSSRVQYGTSPNALGQEASDSSRLTQHSLDLTGLSPGSTYHYRVTSVDAAGNSATSPATGSPPASFEVPTASVVDSSVADFEAGSLGPDTYAGATGTGADGEVLLRPTVGEEFAGGLPADWTATLWETGSGSASVSGGTLTVDGARAGTNALFTPGRALEFTATFASAPYEHMGFGTDYNDAPWAMFSTGGDARGLYARSNDGSATDTAVSGPSPTQPHRYRIVWTATGIDYFVDGTQVASHGIAIGGNMRALASDYTAGGGGVSVDWVRMSPYTPAGTFTSRVLDSGLAGSTWLTLADDASSPGGTQLALETRSGDTASPGGSWSGWQAVGSGGAIASPSARYIQYRAALSSSNDRLTPALRRVAITYRPAGP